MSRLDFLSDLKKQPRMSSNTTYILQSERLGFRQWKDEDLTIYAAMNADHNVMLFFPKTYSEEESKGSLTHHQNHISEHGYGYFAVEDLETQKFIGFIGCCWQDFDHPLSPFVDIGWRLSPCSWGKGLATEGAKAVLEFMRTKTDIKEIYAIAPSLNILSTNVMKKIGMKFVEEFSHPKISAESELNICSLYKIDS